MQNATSIYNFNNHKIRTKLFDGKIHFCGKDVCEAISIKNSKDTMSRLKEGVVITDLTAENEELKRRLSAIKQAVN